MALIKTVKDYPITYKFGFSAAYGGWHSGVDRPAPYGTPIKVNNTIIGYSGNTGYVLPAPTASNPKAGAHHHLTKLSPTGVYLDPKETGFKMRLTPLVKVIATGQDSRSGKWVKIRTWTGRVYVHCHLSKITCIVGQRIK